MDERNSDERAEQLTELWVSGAVDCKAHGMPFCQDCNAFYLRLSVGFELVVSHPSGKPIGETFDFALWNVRAYRFGELIHEIRGLITLEPANHYDAAQSAIVTLKASGIIPADSKQA